MRPSRRSSVNKGRSAKTFRRHSGRTKGANISGGSMRGGWRF